MYPGYLLEIGQAGFADTPRLSCSLYSTVRRDLLCRRPVGEKPTDGVSGDDSEQGAGAAQVQEGAALERQERGAV